MNTSYFKYFVMLQLFVIYLQFMHQVQQNECSYTSIVRDHL